MEVKLSYIVHLGAYRLWFCGWNSLLGDHRDSVTAWALKTAPPLRHGWLFVIFIGQAFKVFRLADQVGLLSQLGVGALRFVKLLLVLDHRLEKGPWRHHVVSRVDPLFEHIASLAPRMLIFVADSSFRQREGCCRGYLIFTLLQLPWGFLYQLVWNFQAILGLYCEFWLYWLCRLQLLLSVINLVLKEVAEEIIVFWLCWLCIWLLSLILLKMLRFIFAFHGVWSAYRASWHGQNRVWFFILRR